MAKTLKVRTVLYDVTADVVVKDTSGKVIVFNFSGEGSDTKSVRKLVRPITKQYEDDGYEVLAVTNIETTSRVAITTYRVDSTVQDIVNACIAANLSVSVVGDSETETDETDETDANA